MRLSILAVIIAALAFMASSGPTGDLVSASAGQVAGDADCNSSVNEQDALAVGIASADVGNDFDCLDLADVNCDNAVDVEDMVRLLKHQAELPEGDVPEGCPQIGSAAGLPALVVTVESGIEVPESATGRPLAAVQGDDGVPSVFVEDELIIVTNDTNALNAFLARWNGTLISTIPSFLGNPAIHLVRIDASGADTSEMAADLREINENAFGQFGVSSTEAAELMAAAAEEAAGGMAVDLNWVAEGSNFQDRKLQESGTAGNPNTWTYMNRDSEQDIGVVDAWRLLDVYGKLGNEAHVAILDGGFVPNADFPSGFTMHGPTNHPNPASCTAGSSCPWHGTIVTAAAVGVPNNSFGVAGPGGPVAHAELTQSPDLSFFDILRYIYDVVATAIPLPDILNISAGVGMPAEFCLTGVCLLMDGITAGLNELGVLMFAAAGNDNLDVDAERCIDLVLGEICYEKKIWLPCELSAVICVGGLDDDSQMKRTASNYGTDGGVDIFGPMVQWQTPTPDSGVAYDSCGTSCASPFVAGVAALIKAANPGLDADGIWDAMAAHMHANSPDPKVVGWVNAYASVLDLVGGNEPPEVDIELPDGTYEGGVPFRLSAHLTDPEDLPFEGGWTGQPAISWTSSLDGPLGNAPLTDPVLLSYGTHTITAVATDSDGATVTDTATWVITNAPPVVDITTPLNDANLFDGQHVIFRGTSTDANRASGKLEDSEVEWFAAPTSNSSNRTSLGTGHRLSIDLDLTPGDYFLTFVGTDEASSSDEDVVTIHVAPTPVDFPPTAEITNLDFSHACFTPAPNYYEFTGVGDDQEDGTLSGASLVWLRSVNSGPLVQFDTGTSGQLMFTDLPGSGEVHVVLRVTDSANNVSEDFYDLSHGCIS